jgi:hypothetical protein
LLALATTAACIAGACYAWSDAGDDDGDGSETPSQFDDDDTGSGDDDASPGDDDDATSPPDGQDGDGDGWPAGEDCDDADSAVNPGASEDCNGKDDDCDGQVDEGVQSNWYDDGDADGYGRPDSLHTGCEPLPGQIGIGGDCDDADPQVNPASTLQVDGQDSDCDGGKDWLVSVWISVDDAFEWCMDDDAVILGSGNDWTQGYGFQEWRDSGPHVVGIKGWDLYTVITAGIAHIQISDGTTWVSDASWKFDPAPAASDDTRSGWCSAGFDDSAWQFVNVIGPIGTSPWGNAPYSFPSGSQANWIWDYYPVNLNTQYLRKEIVLP